MRLRFLSIVVILYLVMQKPTHLIHSLHTHVGRLSNSKAKQVQSHFISVHHMEHIGLVVRMSVSGYRG